MYSRPTAVFAILLMTVAGCSTVSNEEFDERLANIDMDGDGVFVNDDCDDSDPSLGLEMVWYVDGDGDGFGDLDAPELVSCEPIDGYVAEGGDCDDYDEDVNPDADEVCGDSIDNNCDTLIDDPSAVDATVWYTDEDQDGFGDETADADLSCEDLSSTHVQENSDCDDDNGAAYPGADEYCDEVDNNCDGVVDEDTALDALTWYIDYDEDGYGHPSYTTLACSKPNGWAATDDDCDDMWGAVNPGADEYCDGYDNNCDDFVDDSTSVDGQRWYEDFDLDNWGSETVYYDGCPAAGWVADNSDCDDRDFFVNPSEDEYCDGVDNNCDTVIDEDSALDAATWYVDGDYDGYGTTVTTTVSCDEPLGYAALSTDCDDTESHINPGADDGPLNDYSCDGLVDSSTYLSNSFIEFTGENAGDQMGYFVGSIGDVDGDGLGDIAMSAPYSDDSEIDAGKIYIFLGASLTTRGAMSASTADLMFTGAAAGDYLGFSFDGGGDLDGDGIGDLLIGAPGDDSSGSNAGAVYIVTGQSINAFGANGTIQLTWNDGVLVGENAGDQAGYSVSFVDDFYGDGNSDIVVGAPFLDLAFNQSSAGVAYIFRSNELTAVTNQLSDSTLRFSGISGGSGLTYGDRAGFSVAGLEDVGTDGQGEVVVGAPYCDGDGVDRGCAYFILSDTSWTMGYYTMSSVDYVLEGASDHDHYGWRVASAGDFDDDQIGDVLISAPGNDVSGTDNGEAHLFSGVKLLQPAQIFVRDDYYFAGLNTDDMVAGVSAAGDVDGDGVDDIFVSASDYLAGSAVGQSYLFLSANHAIPDYYDVGVSDYSFVGESNGDESGYSISSAGDINGDGLDDLLVAAPLNDDGGTNAGKVYLILSGL